MAAKSWEADFRYAAIQHSLLLFEDVPDDVYEVQQSFCLPIAKRPIVGFTPGKLLLILLVLGFAFLAAGILVVSKTKEEGKFIGLLLSLSGLFCFFVPSIFSDQIVAWFLGPRYRELKNRAGMVKLWSAEISDGDLTKQKISIDGDDFVVVFGDEANRRLLIEGIAARYQIRSEDVLLIEPFVFMNYIGARIICRVGGAELCFAIAKVSLLYELVRQAPVLFFLKRWIKNPVLQSVEQSLGRQPFDNDIHQTPFGQSSAGES